MSRKLLKNIHVMNPADASLSDHPVKIAIENGVILAVGDLDLAESDFDEVTDFGGRTAVPGMINAHTHLYSALAMGMPGPAETPHNFVEILQRVWWKLDRALDQDSTRASFRAGLLECLRAGVTTVIDHHSSPNFATGSLTMLAEEAQRLGMNVSVAFEVTDRNGEADFESGLAENLAAWEAYKDNPFIHPMLGMHASFTLSDASLKRVRSELETRPGYGIHIHLAEDAADEEDSRSRGYGSVVERLNQFGLLNEYGLVIHGLHIGKEDVELLDAASMQLVHNPTSNANNRVGMLSRETIETLHAGLGTDGMQANMLTEAKEGTLIRSSHLIGGETSVDYIKLLFGNNPRIVSDLFGRPIGKIAPGYTADLAIYDYDPRTPLHGETSGGHLLFGVNRPSDVLTAGEVRVRDGRCTGVDEAEILDDAREQSRRLWDAMLKL